ncbi:MAG: hypothetical protein ACREBS_08660 [Nitrososphaerales archaeon]
MVGEPLRVIRRFEILSIIGSGFLFVSSYMLYYILDFIQAKNVVETLPNGTSFVFPADAALMYDVALAVGFFCVGLGKALFDSWHRTTTSPRLPSRFFEYFIISIQIGLYVTCFLGALALVYLQSFNYYVPPLSVRNGLAWQLGQGVFAGLIIIISVIPAIGISTILTNRIAEKKVRQYTGGGINLFMLSTILGGISILSLAAAFLATLLFT